MPLPVIANVFRITFLWNTIAGVTPRNVIHVRSLAFDKATVGQNVLDAFETARSTNEPWACLGNTFFTDSVEVLPLDGSSSSIVVTDSSDGQPGQATGEIIPAAAGLVSFRTNTRGPRGRGRIYIGPTTEGVNQNGLLDVGVVSDLQEAWDAVLVELESHEVPLVVASYTHADAHDVESVFAERPLATQRRRQDQLR